MLLNFIQDICQVDLYKFKFYLNRSLITNLLHVSAHLSISKQQCHDSENRGILYSNPFKYYLKLNNSTSKISVLLGPICALTCCSP